MNIFNFFAMVLFFIDHFLVPLIFAIAFLVFIWGLFTYFIAGGANDEKQKEGRQLALWGIIGFVLMIAVWGIVNVLINSLGFDTKSRPALPTFGGSTQQQTTGGTLFQGGTANTTGGGGGLPLGAACPSTSDAECASGECDYNGRSWVCVEPAVPTPVERAGGTSSNGVPVTNTSTSGGASASSGGGLGAPCSATLPCAAPYQCPVNGNTCVLSSVE